jgi:hypothetical protein
MTQAAERTWRALPPERNEAVSSTIEAVMYELREFGTEQLKKTNTQRRLAELSLAQLREIIPRLMALRPRYPAISDDLLFLLSEQLE